MPIVAWILMKADDPNAFIFVIPKALQLTAAVIGGIITAKCRGNNGLFTSLIAGALFSAVIVTGGIVMNAFNVTMIVMVVLIFASFVLGHIIGTPKEKSSMTKRKEMMKRLK
jgi:hypothetical protein